MDKKRELGQYYTQGNPFILDPFLNWAKRTGLHNQVVLEPFAGTGNIPALVEATGLKCKEWSLFDVDPKKDDIKQKDTLSDFPKGYNVCITNPPWLARNSATRRNIPYPKNINFDDVYKHSLHLALGNCKWVAAIIPESFIRVNRFKERLEDFVSLIPDRIESFNYLKEQQCFDLPLWNKEPIIDRTKQSIFSSNSMFIDTDHPVGLALFGPKLVTDTRIWQNNIYVGDYRTLKLYLPAYSNNKKIEFNISDANLGLIAIDNTIEASIRFCTVEEIADYPVTKQSRSITKIKVPWEPDIDYLNNRIKEIREKTYDVFLTAFKGVRQDKQYRRRLDFTLARSIINEQQYRDQNKKYQNTFLDNIEIAL